MANSSDHTISSDNSSRHRKIVAALLGVAALLVILQGVWAGLYIGDGSESSAANSWMDVHARGADLTILVLVITTVWAFVKLRNRRDIWLGALGLTVLLVLEAYLGGLIRDDSKDSLTAVHVPLALGIMALTVWLPVRLRSHAHRGAVAAEQ